MSFRPIHRALRVLASLVLAAAGTGCSGPELEFPEAKLVLVSLDTLRADHLGFYGYDRPTSPFLDELAKESIVFENVIAQAPWTLPSHAALFTSRYPSELGLRTWPEPGRIPREAVTLAEVLQGDGFRTLAFTDSGWVSKKYGMDQGFLLYDEGGKHFQGILPRLDAVLPRIVNDRFFLFVHTYDVHWYEPPASYLEPFLRPYDGPLEPSDELRKNLQHHDNADFLATLTPEDLRYVIDLYDGEIRFVDAGVQHIAAVLKTRGVWDDAILVVTSDHGEEFLEHGRTGHGYFPYDEQLRVPLLIHLPGGVLGGTRVSAQVRSIDVMPTLLDLLAVPGPRPEMRGRSLVPLLRGDAAARPAFTDRGHWPWVALRTPEWKVLYNPRTGQRVAYRLRDDPGETLPLAADSAPDAALLFEELDRWHQGLVAGQTVETEELTDEERAKLRALGYIE